MEDLKKHIENGCSYGQADGPDDNISECECLNENFESERDDPEIF
ncbi:hypothetical protein LCGC14_3120290 [marine sediment metagenome]|uniref:Uncharacterized protein n=1 Tax=marine sediment metagenome TaxID=412755 RepID=A0A0F8W2I1_9ZZZZ